MKSAVVVGSLNLDYSIALQRMPQPGETIAADSLTLNPGGKGANQAYALGRLGCQTAMIGAVGRDGAGDTLIRNLQSAGVDCSGVLRREEPTGQAFITVDKQGENSIIILHGANYTLTPADIEEKRALIEAADCLVMQLEVPMETVLAAAKLARAAGKTVVLDPAPAPGPLPEELLRLCDFINPTRPTLAADRDAGRFPGGVRGRREDPFTEGRRDGARLSGRQRGAGRHPPRVGADAAAEGEGGRFNLRRGLLYRRFRLPLGRRAGTGAAVCQRRGCDCGFAAGRPGVDPVGGGSGGLYPVKFGLRPSEG